MGRKGCTKGRRNKADMKQRIGSSRTLNPMLAELHSIALATEKADAQAKKKAGK